MSVRFLITTMLGSAVMLAAPAIAQEAAKQVVADQHEQPVTRALNEDVAAANAAQDKQYALDQAAYRAEVAAHKEKIALDEAAYARQQRAYADAMAAWRIQVDECKKGKLKSCDKPTPVPADFY